MDAVHDLAIIGSGFAGSLLALIARRLGRSVVLIERSRHPRFAIGESSTPLANLLLEELARRYELPAVQPLCQWGTWQRHTPHLACGLKRGFSFLHHVPGQPFTPRPDRANELLVAASPSDDVADTHWYRPDFDRHLAEAAVAAGAELHQETRLTGWTTGTPMQLHGEHSGRHVTLKARWVIDASGPRGFCWRAAGVGEEPFGPPLDTMGLHAHFTGVERHHELENRDPRPPYPPDDAALHHVFPGGWIWVLRFNNGITSAGVAATRALATELRLHEGAAGWDRLLARLPSIQSSFARARATTPFVVADPLPFRSREVTGPGWTMLPSAAGIVDPLLSTGFPLALLGVTRLARSLETSPVPSPADLTDYAAVTRRELDLTARLVAGLYRHLDHFPSFAALTRLYFAAASFTETARRLGKHHLCGGEFLLLENAAFQRGLDRCLSLAESGPAGRPALSEAVDAAIAGFDVAGLRDRDRLNWHPVLTGDLLAAADDLQSSPDELRAMLARCGL